MSIQNTDSSNCVILSVKCTVISALNLGNWQSRMRTLLCFFPRSFY
jgi:hypothetical protein